MGSGDGLGGVSDEGDALGHQVARGFRWSIAGQLLSRAGVFATGIALARILTPHDFGVYAVALAAFNLLMMVNELGIVAAIIRVPDEELDDACRTGATVAFAMSAGLAALAFIGAPWFASALGASEATGVLRVLVISVVIDGAMAVPMALLTRTFQQQRFTLAEATGLVAYIATAISLAAGGAGPWSIAVGRVAASLVTAAVLLVFTPAFPRPGFDPKRARSLLAFGVPLTLGALVAEGVMNADYLVVGRTLGPTVLGVYLLAFNLSTWPVSAVLVAIGRVAFAGFARLADDRTRMSRAYVRAIGVIAAASIPLAVLLGVLASEVIRFVYGERWIAASTPLRFLLVLAVARVLIQTTLDFIAADGRPGAVLRFQLVWLVVLVPALIIGAKNDGIRGVGLAHMVVVLFVMIPVLLFLMRRTTVNFGSLGRQFVRPLLGAAASLGVMQLLLTFVSGTVARLVLVGAAGTAVYLAVLVPGNSLISWAWAHLRKPELVE